MLELHIYPKSDNFKIVADFVLAKLDSEEFNSATLYPNKDMVVVSGPWLLRQGEVSFLHANGKIEFVDEEPGMRFNQVNVNDSTTPLIKKDIWGSSFFENLEPLPDSFTFDAKIKPIKATNVKLYIKSIGDFRDEIIQTVNESLQAENSAAERKAFRKEAKSTFKKLLNYIRDNAPDHDPNGAGWVVHMYAPSNSWECYEISDQYSCDLASLSMPRETAEKLCDLLNSDEREF